MTTGPTPPEQPDEPAGQPDSPGQQPPGQPPTPGEPPSYGQPSQPSPPAYGQPSQPSPPSYGQPPQPSPPSYGQPPQAQPPQGQPPYGAQPYPPKPPLRPDDEKLWAIAAHLGPILGLWIVPPLVVWLVFRERSAFLDRQGKEALNFQISYGIYLIVASFSLILLVGIVLLPLALVAYVVFMVIATIKAGSHEDYRYPLIMRFVS